MLSTYCLRYAKPSAPHFCTCILTRDMVLSVCAAGGVCAQSPARVRCVPEHSNLMLGYHGFVVPYSVRTTVHTLRRTL